MKVDFTIIFTVWRCRADRATSSPYKQRRRDRAMTMAATLHLLARDCVTDEKLAGYDVTRSLGPTSHPAQPTREFYSPRTVEIPHCRQCISSVPERTVWILSVSCHSRE